MDQGRPGVERLRRVMTSVLLIGLAVALAVGGAVAQEVEPMLISAQVGNTAEEVFRTYIWE